MMFDDIKWSRPSAVVGTTTTVKPVENFANRWKTRLFPLPVGNDMANVEPFSNLMKKSRPLGQEISSY